MEKTTEKALDVQSTPPATNAVDWDAPAKLLDGEHTGTLTGDIIGDVSEDVINAIFSKNAVYLKDEISKSFAIDEDDQSSGISLGVIIANRMRVMSEVMGVATITRRDAMMALAGVFAKLDEGKILRMGEIFKK